MEYKPTIGLEIHAELKTQTKMFCNSKNDPDETRPNVNVCPICMGHPGTLPVINKEAVRHVLRVGIALNGRLADFTEFDRKNYFYPDLPKGYQISQYKYPLVLGGVLNGIVITRVHLEEDTGRSAHETGDYSLVDFNRAGIPLMELVTEPVIKTAKEAGNFARELQLLLRYLSASEANMEKGEMRVEANVSIAPMMETAENRRKNAEGRGNILHNSASGLRISATLGTKVEVKNINSFKAVEKAIEYEIKRQSELLERGEKVVQETRGWDENKGKTFSQRIKEESHDYRYFPEPDLPKLYLSKIPEFSKKNLKKEISELPQERRKRLIEEFDVKSSVIEILVHDIPLYKFFSDVSKYLSGKTQNKLAINYITSDLLGLLGESRDFIIRPNEFAEIIKLLDEGVFSSRSAKGTLELIYKYNKKGSPQEIAQKHNLIQKSDEEELKKIVEKIISSNPTVVSDFKAGKEQALQFLIGQAMKATKGAANPKVLDKLFRFMTR